MAGGLSRWRTCYKAAVESFSSQNRDYTDAMRRMLFSAVVLLAVVAVASNATTQDKTPPAEISADLGPCSALLTVTDADGKPVYGAKMTTRIQYGFGGVRKLDLEAYTGTDGKVKITKLPETLKKPLIIHIGKDDKADQVEFNPSPQRRGPVAGDPDKPSVHCNATFDVVLKGQ